MLAASCIFYLHNASAQCKYEREEIDKFTKQRLLITEPLTIVDKNIRKKGVYAIDKVDMRVHLESGERFLTLTYFFNLGITIANTKDKLLILLSNGETLELPCLHDLPGQRRKGIGGGVAVLSFDFGIDSNAFNKLCYANVTDMRMAGMINPVEFAVRDGISTMALFRCIK